MLNLNLKNNNINQIKNIKELVSKNKVITLCDLDKFLEKFKMLAKL